MYTFLIVDDETDIVEYINDVLESNFPCTVHTASNGLEALVKCKFYDFNIICSDYKMPHMTGGGFLTSLRTEDSRNKNTPFIFISGFISSAKEDALNLDNVFFLDKPISEKRFVQYMKMVLPKN